MTFMESTSSNGIAEAGQKPAGSSLRFKRDGGGDAPSPLHLIASSRRGRIERVFAQAIALALLCTAIPESSAQQITSHNSKEDFNTLGVAGGNKGPQGLWSDGTTMLVSDVNGRIYSYNLNSEHKERQDSHRNDRPDNSRTGGNNADDFILFKNGDSDATIRPYGLWFDTRNNNRTNTLWVASTEGSKTNKTAKLYAYKTWWVTTNSVSEPEGEEQVIERYLMGKRFTETNQDINLHREITSLPDLDDDGNPIVFEVSVNNGTTNKTRLTYGSVIENGKTNYHLLNKHMNRLTPNDAGKLTIQDAQGNAIVYENENNQFETNMVTGPVGNLSPTGIWSDGTTMWVADQGDIIKFESIGEDERFISPDKIYAYNLWTNAMGEIWTSDDIEKSPKMFDGSLNTNKVIQLSSYGIHRQHDDDKNTYAQGIWSDEETMWVADTQGSGKTAEKRIYAYNMTTKLRNPDKDFKTLNEAGNDRPRGIWSDGETMWVADQTDNKLYAYHAFRSTTSRNLNAEFDTLEDAGNNDPRGIWSDGETMWVTDYRDDKLYAYDLATKERMKGGEFTLGTVDKFPQSLWSDGETMWVAHFLWSGTESKIFAYNLSTKARDADEDFDTLLAAGNENPVGLWSNGTTMWVADSQDGKIYAYKMSDKSRDSSKDFDTLEAAGNTKPKGIYSDGTTMWVADFDDDKIYAYKMSDKSRDSGKDFDTLKAAGNNAPFGIWSDDTTTMWVLDSDNGKIYAYPLSDAARLGKLELKGHIPSRQNGDFKVQLEFNNMPIPSFNSGTTTNYTASVPFATSHLTVSPKTLRPNDTTASSHRVNLIVGDNPISITVTNGQATSLPRTRTYKVTVKREFFTYNDPSKDILVSTNFTIRGLWANETTLWVADDHENKLHAYKRSDGSLDSLKDIPLASANSKPRGIFSNGTTMWVVDFEDKKLYAYGLTNRTRLNSTNDFELTADNANPQWIWSDGATMWVTDANKIYAYKMSGDKKRDESREIDLGELVNDNNDAPTGIWSDGANLWVANSDTNNAKIYSYKLAGNRIDCREETKDFNTLEAANNHDPEAIFSDGSIMYVADSKDGKIYAYNQPLSGNAWLKTLTLSGDVFYGAQPFQLSNPTTHYNYNLWVDSTTATTTITAEAQNSNAVFSEISINSTNFDNGSQLPLRPGSNEIKIRVTSENGVIDTQYTVNISRIGNDRRIRQLDFNNLDIGDLTGIYSDGKTMWVADAGREDTLKHEKVYAYKMSGEEWGQLDADKTFELEMGAQPRGLWSDGTTMWVSDGRVRDNVRKIDAYTLWTNPTEDERMFAGRRDSSQDIEGTTLLGGGFTDPEGLWGDSETMWVVSREAILAYTNRTRFSSKDINLSTTSKRDVWSNGTTMWVLNVLRKPDEKKLYAYMNFSATSATARASRDAGKDITIPESIAARAIWSNGEVMWVASTNAGEEDVPIPARILAYRMPTASGATGGSDFFFSEDSTLKALQLSGATLTPAFSADNLYYTALVDHTVHSATVTATSNDAGASVDILSGVLGTTRSEAARGPQVSFEEGYNIIAIDVLAESRTNQSTYLIRVTKAEAPPTSGGPLPQPQSFQPSTTSSASQTALADSSAGIGEWKSRLIFAEPLLDGGVRFVFLVPPDELKIEENPDLTSGEWRPLLDDEFQVTRESNVDGPDRLTIILPKAAGKQRFLRLTPLK